MANTVDPDLQPLSESSSGAMQIPHDGTPTTNSRQTIVQVGEETIQIVPHPTTNRFPWTPVENPTIPIYQTLTAATPAPTVAPASSMPVAAPIAPAAPQPITPNDTLLAVADELLAAAAVSPPMTPPMSVSLPPVVSLPPPPVAKPIIQPLEHKSFQANVAEITALPVPQKHSHKTHLRRPAKLPRDGRIYGVSTREVWHVLRPAARIRFLTIVVMFVIFVFAMGYWLRSAAPIEVRSIPIVRMLIGGA